MDTEEGNEKLLNADIEQAIIRMGKEPAEYRITEA